MRDSKSLFEAACRRIPGGVNSPVRAFRAVGGDPFFVAYGKGARIWDVDGRSYLDFLGSWGPLILGHAAPPVVAAVTEAAARGTSYGAPTGLEVEMAEAITAAYPSIELVRLVSSGTEAAMSAIRLARGATGRSILLKFDGCYHGHADSLLVKAGSGGATFSIPDSAGVPPPLAALTPTAPFNDLHAAPALFRARGDEIARGVVEPGAGDIGGVAPLPRLLAGRPAGSWAGPTCTRRSTHAAPCSSAGSERAPGRRASRSRSTASARCSPRFSATARSPTTRRRSGPTPRATPATSTRCASAACSWRPRSSRPRSSRSPTRRPTSSSRPGQPLTLSRRFRAEPAKTLTQYGVGDRLHKHHSIPRRAIDCRWAHGRAWERWGLCSSPFWSFWRSRPGAGSRQSRSLRSSRSPSRIACTCRRTRWTASTATAMRGARNTPACRRSRAAWAATRSRARRCRR